jgi:hypothetical protein
MTGIVVSLIRQVVWVRRKPSLSTRLGPRCRVTCGAGVVLLLSELLNQLLIVLVTEAVTRKVTIPNPTAVQVNVNAGQFLHFTLDAKGPVPIFSFASNIKGTLYDAPDFPGHPTTRYEWVHLRNPSDFQQLELLDLGLSFLTNADYTYAVDIRDANSPVANVLNIAYTGSPTDFANEGFRVVLA